MKVRLLLNAEPFGFGPTAAIAAFFPFLRPSCGKLTYAGLRHTLDLQRGLPYDLISDLTGQSPAAWRSILRDHDALLTALDYDVARLAIDEGLKVAFYDPLLWYHPKIPDVASHCLYLAQDFFGVAERLQANRHLLVHAQIVPPIVDNDRVRRRPEIVLINLGGIQNPIWPLELSTAYAETIIASIRNSAPSNLPLQFAVSDSIARQLSQPDVQCRTPREIKSLMSRSAIAFITPGLGNIYDAAEQGLPTVWLPPANDSQGRQLLRLRQEGFLCAGIDWADLGSPVNYEQSQNSVLARIATNIQWLAGSAGQAQLCRLLSTLSSRLLAGADHDSDRLLRLFGSGGAERVATLALDWFRS